MKKTQIVTFLNESCNFSCSYCTMDKEKVMNDITFEKTKEFILEQGILGSAYTIIGGEPLVVDKRVIEFIDFLTENGVDQSDVHLVTNGFFKERILGILDKYPNIQLYISYDGKVSGRGSEEIILQNIKDISKMAKDNLYIQSVISYENQKHMVETYNSVKDYISPGKFAFNLENGDLERKALLNMNIILENIRTIIFAEKKQHLIDSLLNKDNVNCTFCEPDKTFLVVTSDGSLYNCGNMLHHKEKEQFIIGDIWEGVTNQTDYGFDCNKMGKNLEVGCVECGIKCEGVCQGVNLKENEDPHIVTPIICDYNKGLEKIRKDFIEDFVAPAKDLDNLTLVLTKGCNLNCTYCYEKTQDCFDQEMSFETAKLAIDSFFRNNTTTSRRKGITFFGGEPFLKADLMSQIFDYNKSKGYDCYYDIITNGTVFNEEVKKAMTKWKELGRVNIQISVDGTKATHDKNRVFKNGTGSFDVVMENIDKFKEFMPDANIYYHCVLSNDTYSKMSEITKFACNKGFINNFSFRFMKCEDTELDFNQEIFKEEMKKSCDILDETFGEHSENYKKNILSFNAFRSKIACSAGHYALAINHNGDVFPCHRAMEIDELNFGNVNTNGILGIFENTDLYNRIKQDTEYSCGSSKCSECDVTSCITCPIFNYERSKDFQANPKDLCDIEKLKHEIIEQVIDIKKENAEMEKKLINDGKVEAAVLNSIMEAVGKDTIEVKEKLSILEESHKILHNNQAMMNEKLDAILDAQLELLKKVSE